MANVAIDAPCSGNVSCGKCRVKLLGGKLVSPRNVHIDNAPLRRPGGWPAALRSSDATVLVPDIASAYRSRMKVADLSSPEEWRFSIRSLAALEVAGLTRERNPRARLPCPGAPTLADTIPG